MKRFLKAFKPEKKSDTIVANLSIEGPSNQSNVSEPKIGKGFEVKIDAKSSKANDQKIATKNSVLITLFLKFRTWSYSLILQEIQSVFPFCLPIDTGKSNVF